MNRPIETTKRVVGSEPTVVTYRDEFAGDFEELNREWIETYFVLEDADREVLGDPRGKIIQRGGEIFFVLDREKVMGTCAVLRHDAEDYEIAKMAVVPAARGRGYGHLLMEAAVSFCRRAGARRVIIVSNTVLDTAIHLYLKHGFVRVPMAADVRFQRANIRLERRLEPTEPGGASP